MLLELLFRKTSIPILSRALDVASFQQRVIAKNIANISTPGYQKEEVSFEEDLRKAIRGEALPGAVTSEAHIPLGGAKTTSAQPRAVKSAEATDVSGAHTGRRANTVDVDTEMAELAQNQIFYSTAAKLIARNFTALKASIRGRSIT